MKYLSIILLLIVNISYGQSDTAKLARLINVVHAHAPDDCHYFQVGSEWRFYGTQRAIVFNYEDGSYFQLQGNENVRAYTIRPDTTWFYTFVSFVPCRCLYPIGTLTLLLHEPVKFTVANEEPHEGLDIRKLLKNPQWVRNGDKLVSKDYTLKIIQ